MSKPRRAVRRFTGFLIAALLTFPQFTFAQSASCVNATLMCPDQGATTYPASINASNPNQGNNYGCLGSQPNPAWFYLHVGSSGASTIVLTNSQTQDIDFAMWGPFPDLPTALGTCGSLPAPTDCSFHPQANETVTFPSANPGDIFLLLITNFSNQPTQITASDPMWPGSNFSCIDPACQADAGDISMLPFDECFQSSNLNLPLSPNYSGSAPNPFDFDYGYLITDATGSILFDSPTPDLTNTPPGTYQVCGISYHNNAAGSISGLVGQDAAAADAALSSTSPPFCGDITDVCVDVTIYPTILDTNLPDEYICPGECVTGPDGGAICVEGFFTFMFIGSGGCDSTVNLMVYEKTEGESFIIEDVCPGGCITIAGQQVCAPNSTQIILPNASSNGCDSIINVSFNEIFLTTVIDAAPAEITCANPTVILDGSNSTPGVDYEWRDAAGNSIGTNSTLGVTQSGTYTLEISLTQNGVTCTDIESVFVPGNSLPPSISTSDTPEICEGEAFDLAAIQIIDINNLSPQLTFHSGTPATGANQISGLVNPFQTTDFYILAEAGGCTEELMITVTVAEVPEFSILDAPQICEGEDFDLSTLNINHFVSPDFLTYHDGNPASSFNEINPLVQPSFPTYYTVLATLGNCTYEEEVLMDVLPMPQALFDFDNDKICLTDSVQVTYSGGVAPSGNFTWDFGGATAMPGIGAGPHTLKFDQFGNFQISLTVEENGCTSFEEIAFVEVFDTISAPVISCQSGLDSILFEWDEVGADNYSVQILTNQSVTQITDSSLILNNLSLGEEVTVLLTAQSPNLCQDQVVRATCMTNDCPQFSMAIDPVDTICLDASAEPILLSGTVVGANPSGIVFWSGIGVTDSVSGIFNPKIAGAGLHSIFLNYEEAGCLQTERVTIHINAQPTADFTIPINTCIGESVEFDYTGTASSDAIFNWNFDSGIQTNKEVLWNESGVKNITLVVTEKKCASEIFTQSIEVSDTLAKPIINCHESLENIVFEWNQVLDADGYEVLVDGVSQGHQLTENYEITDLQPGDEIEITVIANSETACPNVSTTKVCAAQNCPDLLVEIAPVDTICENENALPIQLSATVTVSDGSGIGTWTGTGISIDGVFDPQLVGAGTWTVNYNFTENNCATSESFQILVQPAPNTDFTIDQEVCVGETADFEFSIPTAPNALPAFDFDFSQNDINAGAGPFGVSWSEAGVKTVSYTVKEGKCISSTEKQVTVFEKLTPPVIECVANETTVEFQWTDVVNASNYDAQILNAPGTGTSVQNDDFSYSFENLNPGDSVSISLLVSENGSPCDGVEVTKTCVAAACPDIELVLKDLQNTCFVPGFSEQLSVEILRGSADGRLTWSGEFMTPSGEFTPTEPGIFTVAFSYDWNGCEYFGANQVEIFETPIAAFENESPVCIDSMITIDFTGSQLPDLTFNWTIENMAAGSVLDESPQINFTQSGISNIGLQVESNGCISNVATGRIQVDVPLSHPQIECVSTETEVEFSWNDDSQITDRQIAVLTGQQGVLNGNSFTIEDLQPKTKVIIDLTSSGSSICGPVKTSATCATKECPLINFETIPVPSVCINADISEIQLTDYVDINHQNPTGEWTWNGSGVSSDGDFDFSASGVGIHEVRATYKVFGVCSYERILTVEVLDLPIADASAEETVLDCAFTPLYVGGPKNIDNNPDIDYAWSGSGILETNGAVAIVERPGKYVLTAIDRTTGCSSSDEVVIEMTDNLPKLTADMNEISCFGKNDGAIITEEVLGGMSPYLFALNDDNFSFEQEFKNLPPGRFELIVQDADFCTDTVFFEINEPKELQVELKVYLDNAEIGDGETIEWGNEVTLDACSTPSFSERLKIDWTPVEFANLCEETNCSELQFMPNNNTEISVRVENENGCFASDRTLIRVKKTRPVFIPSAFSPRDSDGINDTFDIFAKSGTVAQIRTFRVFDRWGGLVFDKSNFEPSEGQGWDGRFRGKTVDSGVYVYFTEVEFTDGESEIFEGDVTVW